MSSHSEMPARRPARTGLHLIAMAVVLVGLLAVAGCDGSSGGGAVTAGVFVADVTGAIHQVDLTTGSLTFIADSGIPDLYALAFDATTSKVFGGTGTSRTCEGCVYSLDAETWTPTGIETSGLEGPIWDMTVPPTDGILYAVT